jgi:hypothetical protein
VVALGPDGHITDASIRLRPLSVITGHVVDENGERVDRAQVLLFKLAYRDGRKRWDNRDRSTTNDTGEFRFPNLKRGRYILQAFDPRPPVDNRYGSIPTMFSIPAYYPNAVNQQQASPVDVRVGADVAGIDIHLSKLARPANANVHIRGRVIGLPRDSRIVVSVALHPVDDGVFGCCGNTSANPPDYAFDLTVPRGQYTISAKDYSAEDPEVYGTGALTVTGDMAGVVIAMTPVPEIRGRVLLAEGGGQVSVQGLRVALYDTFTHAHEAGCDAAGGFVFGKPFMPGNYNMKVLSVPDGFFIRETRLGGQEISPDDFEISASGQLEIVLSGMAATIGGSVHDADDQPFANSKITLIALEGRSRPSRTYVDDDGNFRFTGLRPGKYSLFAWEEVDDDLWQDPEFLKKYEDRATEVTVGPRETQTAKLRVISAEEMK